MSKRPVFIAFVIIVVIAVMVAILLFTHILSLPTQKAALSNPNSISSLFTQAQSLYNSSSPFNNSYTFLINFSSVNSSLIGNQFLINKSVNGKLQIAKYGDYIRASLIYSVPYPYSLFNASLVLNENIVDIYDGSHLTFCSKQSFTNESPINTSLESVISTQDQKPMSCNSTAMVLSSFNMANTFAMFPFSMLNAPQSSNFNSFTNSGGNVNFLGYKTYLGNSCSVEILTPPPNTTGSAGVSFEDCISSTNGLPLYSRARVNGSTFIENTISAINAAPASISTMTALPPGAVLG